MAKDSTCLSFAKLATDLRLVYEGDRGVALRLTTRAKPAKVFYDVVRQLPEAALPGLITHLGHEYVVALSGRCYGTAGVGRRLALPHSKLSRLSMLLINLLLLLLSVLLCSFTAFAAA